MINRGKTFNYFFRRNEITSNRIGLLYFYLNTIVEFSDLVIKWKHVYQTADLTLLLLFSLRVFLWCPFHQTSLLLLFPFWVEMVSKCINDLYLLFKYLQYKLIYAISIIKEVQWRIHILWIWIVIINNDKFYFHSWSIFLNSTLIKDHNPIKCNTNHDNDIPLKTSSFIKHVSRLIQYDLVFNVAWSWYIILQ